MQHPPGARLGHYEIIATIGAGGMGEVYRARDTKLDRVVAIKVLPELFAVDADRLARFEREAKTLAALNHPNIAQIYGHVDVPSRSGAPQLGLVMELVEGETLAEHIARTPHGISIDDALPIARQIADALEAAHECGVIHRDLKPANIKVRPDGVVKVLDFGLAKAASTSGSLAPLDSANSPTFMSPAVTGVGVIMGTAAYMAPEQARGRQVDSRADIWAFGVTLYEMLTGAPLFAGTSASDVLASVLRDEPKWQSLPPDVPPSVRRVLRRCLQKDPQLRLRHAGDIRIELTDEEAVAAPISTTVRAPRSRWVAVAVTSVIALAAVAIAGVWLASRRTELPLRKWVIQQDAGDEIFGRDNVPAISPDGRYVAYTDGPRLRIRDLTAHDHVEIAGSGVAGMPAWAPDGRQVAFVIDNKTLWKVAPTGGAAVKVGDIPAGVIFGLVWRRDRTIVANVAYGPTAAEIVAVPDQGGAPQKIAADGNEAVLNMRGLPDDSLIYWRRRNNKAETVVLAASGGVKVLDLPPHHGASYSPTGHLLYVGRESPGIWAVPFDLSKLSLTGRPFRIADHGTAPNVSADGTLVYGRSVPGSRQLMWFTRDGNMAGAIGQPQDDLHGPAISPDGTRVAVAGVEQGARNIFVHEVGRRSRSRVTFGTDDVDPSWHPKDGRIVFQNAFWDVLAVTPDGGKPQPLANDPAPEFHGRWSHDGRYFVYGLFTPQGTVADIWMREAGGKPRAFIASQFDELLPEFSPDSRHLAYVSNETGRNEVFVRAFPGGEGKTQVSTNGGMWPKWRGNEIFWVEGGDKELTLMAAVVRTTPAFKVESPKALFKFENRTDVLPLYDTPDGTRFAVVTTVKPPKNGIVVVQNWASEYR